MRVRSSSTGRASSSTARSPYFATKAAARVSSAFVTSPGNRLLRVNAQSGKALNQRAVHVLARWVEVAEVEHHGIHVVVVLAPELAVGGAFDREPPIVPVPDVEGNAVA